MRPAKAGLAVATAFSFGLSTSVLAAPYTVQISEVEMNNNSLYIDASGNPEPAIVVRGTFTPALPCAQQGFFLIAGDPFFSERSLSCCRPRPRARPWGSRSCTAMRADIREEIHSVRNDVRGVAGTAVCRVVSPSSTFAWASGLEGDS